MGKALWIALAVGILILLPVAAVEAARRWRDPPRERWDASAQMRAAADHDPALAEYRVRLQFGLRDERQWTQVTRAVQAGRAAPVPLRSAARAVAEARLRTQPLTGPRWVLALRYLVPGLFVTSAIVGALAGHLAVGLAYLGLAVFYFLRQGPLALRRQAHRAKAALAANADPGPGRPAAG